MKPVHRGKVNTCHLSPRAGGASRGVMAPSLHTHGPRPVHPGMTPDLTKCDRRLRIADAALKLRLLF